MKLTKEQAKLVQELVALTARRKDVEWGVDHPADSFERNLNEIRMQQIKSIWEEIEEIEEKLGVWQTFCVDSEPFTDIFGGKKWD